MVILKAVAHHLVKLTMTFKQNVILFARLSIANIIISMKSIFGLLSFESLFALLSMNKNLKSAAFSKTAGRNDSCACRASTLSNCVRFYKFSRAYHHAFVQIHHR